MYNIDYSSLPCYMQGGVQRYIEEGVSPGGFLTAVISNDLFRAFSKADDNNRRVMMTYVQFFYNQAPATCYGGPTIMKAWMEKGGLNGSRE